MPNVMLINCPHCEAAYKVERQTVIDAFGKMHCGNCKEDFEQPLGALVKPPEFMAFPDFQPKPSVRQRAALSLAIAALLMLLAVQLLAWNWQTASASRFAPTLAAMCQYIGCELHGAQAKSQLTITQQRSELKPGATVISAILSNNGPEATQWPKVRMVALDSKGEAIAAKDIEPVHYSTASDAETMPARHSKTISLAIEPVAGAASYGLRVLPKG